MQRTLSLAKTSLGRSRQTAAATNAATAQRLDAARRRAAAKLAEAKASHDKAVAKASADLAAATRALAPAAAKEAEARASVARAAALLQAARLNATPPQVWQDRVAAAEKAVEALSAKQAAEVAAERAKVKLLVAGVSARLLKMRKQNREALAAAKRDEGSKKESAQLQLAQVKLEVRWIGARLTERFPFILFSLFTLFSQTSFIRTAANRAKEALAGLQAQLNDVTVAVAPLREQAAKANATMVAALIKPLAWINAAEKQLAAVKVGYPGMP